MYANNGHLQQMPNKESVKVLSEKQLYAQLAIVNTWLIKATSKRRKDVQVTVEPSCGCLMPVSLQLVQSAHSPICLKTDISMGDGIYKYRQHPSNRKRNVITDLLMFSWVHCSSPVLISKSPIPFLYLARGIPVI